MSGPTPRRILRYFARISSEELGTHATMTLFRMTKVICAAQAQTNEIGIAVILSAAFLVGMLELQAVSVEAVQFDFRSICTALWIVRHSSPEKRGHLYLICPVLLFFVVAALGLAREKATVGRGQPYPINTK